MPAVSSVLGYPPSANDNRLQREQQSIGMAFGLGALALLATLIAATCRLGGLEAGFARMPWIAVAGFSGSGIALIVDALQSRRPQPKRWLQRLGALVSIAAGGAGLVHWLANSVTNFTSPLWISLGTSSALILMGIALLDDGDGQTARLRSAASIGAFMIGLTGFVGNLYDLEISSAVTGMLSRSTYTALLTCCVSFGILLARPRQGVMRLASDGTIAGLILRRLYPAVLIVPVALGALVIAGLGAGAYSSNYGIALLSALNVVFFSTVIGWTSLVALRIDERRNTTEKRLSDSEQRLNAIFELAAVGIGQISLDGRFLRANRQLQEILGYSAEELQSLQFQDITFAEDLATDEAYVAQLIAGDINTYSMEKRYIRKDGRLIWTCLTVALVRSDDGTPKYFISVVQDVDKKKASEFELLRMKADLETRVDISSSQLQLFTQQYAGIMDSMTDLIVACDRDKRVFAMNRSFSEAFKRSYGTEIRIGDRLPDLLKARPDTYDDSMALWERGLREDFTVTVPYLRQADGSARIYDITSNRLFDANGEVIATVKVSHDVTEQTRVSQALERAKDEAEKANQAKSIFLANISHELRTPLGVILGYADVLGKRGLSEREREESASIIRRNSDNLLAVVNDLLDLSRAESADIGIKPRRFELIDMVAEVIAYMRLKAQNQGLQLDWRIDGPVPETVFADPERLRQILLNLISNSLKFTDTGCIDLAVSLRDDGDGQKLRFRVHDTGIGIPTEEQGELFKPFSQANYAIARQRGGIGLGLSLVRALARAMGGDVVLVDSERHRGTTFEVTIDPGSLTGIPRHEGGDKRPTPELPAEAATRQPPGLQGMAVMLVEDMPDNRLLFRKLLEDAGVNVTVVNDGASALASITTGARPDLVLMDVQMPGLDGHATTKELRRRGFDRPILALTAHAMQEERDRCLASGFTGFLSKPIHRTPLLAAVSRYGRRPTQMLQL